MKSAAYLTLLFSLFLAEIGTEAQRVAPGVPPQHYQGVDPNQQHFQHQQVPQQQFQQGHPPPPQHQQQFVQQQHQQQQQFVQHPSQVPPHQGQPQVPPQQAGGHGHGHGAQPFHGQAQQLLDTSNIGKERQHIQEHMDVPIDTSQMSEQELQFHYFKMHDSDNNNKLDGCELVKSLIHWHDASNHDHRGNNPAPEAKIFTDQELINMIDPILQNDDKNGDGFIDYAEFSLAQAAAAQKGAGQPPQHH